MARLVMVLALVATLTVCATARAGTTVQQVGLDATIPICNGDLVHVAGRLLVTSSLTVTASGGLVAAIHVQPQGVSGVDLSTGTAFLATGLTRDLVVFSPAGGFDETYVNEFRIQATSGEQSFIVTTLFHITGTPDGNVAVVVIRASTTC
jgi:hypothetical protein